MGTGARLEGGRWNYPGTSVIYASASIAIAALEKFVHLAGVIPLDLVLVRVELQNNCSAEQLKLADLPQDWSLVPPGPTSMAIGTTWATENRSLVLYAPSVLVPEENNVLINPNHPEFRAVKMSIERDYRYDPRMHSR